MASFSVFVLGEDDLTISGGVSLGAGFFFGPGGFSSGSDGSHLLGQTITLNNDNLQETFIRDGEGDTTFDDNDGDQVLDGTQTIGGTTFADGTQIDAEYLITLEDPDGNVFQAVGYNVRNSFFNFASVEGLAFVESAGGLPPVGVPLTVIAAEEGPGDFGNAPLPAEDIVAPCFTPGTRIFTQSGLVRVEELSVGDKVQTMDHGWQPIRWIGQVHLTQTRLRRDPSLRPIQVRANAFGPGQPMQDMMLSPQHRVLVRDWRAELMLGNSEWLAAISHLVNDTDIHPARDVTEVTYIHFLFDRHEVVCADGLWAESYLPGPMTLPALNADTQEELFKLFPELENGIAPQVPAARPIMKRWETRLLA